MSRTPNFKLVVSSILLLIIAISTWALTQSNNQHSSEKADVKPLGRINASLQALPVGQSISTADLIAKVQINKIEMEISEPSEKTILDAKIMETIKPDAAIENKETIRILQQGNSRFSFNGNKIFQPSEQYILFLKRAVGEGYDHTDTYWILGEETNIYEVLENGLLSKWALTDSDLSAIEEHQITNISISGAQILNESKFTAFIQKAL